MAKQNWMKIAAASLLLLLLLVGCAQTEPESHHTAMPEPVASDAALQTATATPDTRPYRQIPTSELVAFTNVNVVAMDSECILPGQTVIVHGDRIIWIESATETPLAEGTMVIEGQDKYLLPALADMHVHISSEEDFLLYVANGVTVVREMNGRPGHFRWREEMAAGELFGPILYVAGPIIDGNPSVYSGGTLSVETAQEAREVVRAQKEAGYDFIKVYSLLSKEAYDAIVAEAREQGLSVVGHVPVSVGVEYALEMGQYSLEHLLGYAEAVESADSPLYGQWSYRYLYGAIELDEARILEIAQATRAAGAWNCPTLVAMDRWILAEEAQSLLEQPHMRYISPHMRARWSRMRGFIDTWLAGSDAEARRHGREVRRLIVKGLRDAGAGLLLGTDAGSTYVEPGFSIHVELQNLVEAGLTPYEAIRAGTRDAAEFLGALDEFGTVAVGKRADLILLEDNPLKDVANLQRRAGVMVRGQWLSEATLRQMLEDLVASYGP